MPLSTDKLVVPLTGVLTAAVVLVGIVVAYFQQKDVLEETINDVKTKFGESIAEISKGMGALQAGYEIRISNLETAELTDITTRLKRVEELTSTDQVTGWNRWRGSFTIKVENIETWRLQTDRLFEANRDSVQRAWNKINQFHGSQ